MAPKKPKVSEANLWRAVIEDAPLDEEKWKVEVVVIEAAGSDQDRIYLSKFEACAAQERRFVIKNICKTETIFMVNQLGGEKKVRDDNLRVFEEGQAYLRDKKDIPPDILALLIKHLILKMKEEYLFIQKQKLEVKEGMRRESVTMIDNAEVRGTVNVNPSEPAEPSPPPPKSKGRKGTPELLVDPEPEEGKKYNTLLRLRGEEWRDKVYVDDFPTDGPNLYVAVTGFVDPDLPSALVKIGIPLKAVAQVRIDANSTKVPSSLNRATKRGQSQTEILGEKSLQFWEDLQLLRINKATADDFKNTAFIIFSPPYWDSESLSGDPDKIYDEMCFLMYDVQDLTRQHARYLENMDIILIPLELADERCGKYYHQQIDDIPLECVTTYSVLDSILQTVCKVLEQDDKSSSSKTSLSPAVTMNKPSKNVTDEEKIEIAEKFVKEVFNALCKTEVNKKVYRLTYGEEYEDHVDPTIIKYGNIAQYSNFHLGNINLDNIVRSSLLGMPLNNLWTYQDRPHGQLEAKINFHVNVLLSCFEREDVETAELNRLIHILCCRKLFNNRSSLKKKHLLSSTLMDFKKIYLKRSILAKPFVRSISVEPSFSSLPSFPSMTKSENSMSDEISSAEDSATTRIKFLFDCPDISELVSAAELASGTPIKHMIDDYEHFEDFVGVSAFQIMLEAFTAFNCVDYKYCEVTDCFVMMFFNSHDKDGIARDEWRCQLATPLCLQDFFDYVLEERYEWIQNEEKMYEEAMVLKKQSTYKFIEDPHAHKSCVGDMEVEYDLLMEGSIKFQQVVGLEDNLNPEVSDIQGPISQKSTQSPTSTEMDTKSSRKPKSSPMKNVRQLINVSEPSSDLADTIPPKPFLGYDLSDRRLEVFGKDATYFSRDGTRVLSIYTLMIPMNLEYINLSVVPGNSHNTFWVHRALGDTITPEMVDICESFRITTKDQVLINIKKQTYKVPLPGVATTWNEDTQNLFETKSFHSLFVTWPNGLITESVHEKNSPEISHVKQYYAFSTPNRDEDMRCISLNGEVLVFKRSGDVEVLKPDGSLLTITKWERQSVSETPDVTSVASSDKESKKGKGKEKTKEKRSKQSLSAGDKEEEKKPLEEKFVIQEFEIIETSGLRQKWIDEHPFTIEKLPIRTATDYCLGEVFSRRMDGTHILLNKDGVQVVTFPNKTRIITRYIAEDDEVFPEWTLDEKECFGMLNSETMESDTAKSKVSIGSTPKKNENIDEEIEEKLEEEEWSIEKEKTDGYISIQIIYTIEHANFTTVTISKADGKITVESPNKTAVVINTDNTFDITLDKVTTANFNGENLHIKYEACPECRALTTCDIKIKPDDMSSVTKFSQNWLRMQDSFFKRIVVNEEGNVNLIEDAEETLNAEEAAIGEESPENIDDAKSDKKSESSATYHGKCSEMYLAKMWRFFVLKRELTCSELVHRSLVEQYQHDCRWHPWCSINKYDSFGDQRSLISQLTPVQVTETEKWLMDSKLADKPKCLTYKDLQESNGKGFYYWMRPYDRFEPKPIKPSKPLLPRLPRAFVLRVLEQQWQESNREKHKGARELTNAILRYRAIIEADSSALLHVPLVDMRTDDERRIDDVIQALAHRIYKELKLNLADDVQGRARASVTTRPPTTAVEPSVEGEIEEEENDDLKILEEKRRSMVKQIEDGEEMSPNLKRYWNRRNEEFKEELFYKQLLRESNIPPYFCNLLGGSIWWDVDNAAANAVTRAERRKMKCLCADEGSSQGWTPFK